MPCFFFCFDDCEKLPFQEKKEDDDGGQDSGDEDSDGEDLETFCIDNYLFQLSEEEEKTEKKGLDKPDSIGNKKGKGDSDDDDEDDVPSIFKRKSPLHVKSFRKSQSGSRRSSRVVVDKDDDDDGDDVFTKTLNKMKDTRGRSNVGVKRTSFSSYGQNPHPGSRKKQFLSEYFLCLTQIDLNRNT